MAVPKRRRQSKAIQEVKKLQMSTDLLIPREAFKRLTREIVFSFSNEYRIEKRAYEPLQESAEMYIVQLFEDSLLLMFHRKRHTLNQQDFRLAKIIGSPYV